MENENKLVSILIPTYNREKYIKECVESALNQSYENIEVIVVDNNSNDNSWSILLDLVEKNNKLKIFRNNENIGPVRNWIECINKANGYYGKILWSDDFIHQEFVKKTVDLLQSGENLGFVYTSVEVFNDEWKRVIYKTKTGIYNTKDFINNSISEVVSLPVSPGCALFRMKDIRKNLLLNIPKKLNYSFGRHAIGNDLLLFLLTANQYEKYGAIEETLSFFRAHSDSITVKELSNTLRIPFYYRLAKIYFIEHYSVTSDTIKRFNTKLRDFIGKGIEVDGYIIKSIKDVYDDKEKAKMKYTKLQLYCEKIKLSIINNGIWKTTIIIIKKVLIKLML